MRVERLKEELPLEVDIWAYDLRPGLPPQGLPREEVYKGSRYSAEHFAYLFQVAEEAGINMVLPALVANTGKAHEATEFAKEAGKPFEYNRAVFRAYWEGGEDIGQADVLCRLAGECGMDGEELRRALAEGRYRQRVEEQMRWSRQAGIGGIPTFVFSTGGGSASGGTDRFALMGAQSYEVFLDVAQRLLRGELPAGD